MSRVITSPIPRWAGTVTLRDPLYLPQAELIDEVYLTYLSFEKGKQISFAMLDKPKLPAIIACVEKWELADFPEVVTAGNFPMSPKADRRALIDWLWSEIEKIYNGETTIPNE